MRNCEVVNFNKIGDERGSLIFMQNGYNLLFDIKRIYYIFDTKNEVKRGFHAHKNLKQMLIALSGSCIITIDDGQKREDIKLDNPSQGLLIEGLIWREMKDFSSDCVLLVLASEYYDENDYIRDYDEFLIISNKGRK